jgi:hypothetical protein
LAFKESKDPVRPAFSIAEVLALLTGWSAHAGMVVNGVQMIQMKMKIEDQIDKSKKAGRKWNNSQDDIDREVTRIAQQWTNESIGEYGAELTAGAGAVLGLIAAKAAQYPAKVDPHTDAQGEIRLFKGGASMLALKRKQKVVLHESGVVLESDDADIELRADKAILLESNSANITVKGKTTKFGTTKIKQKNLIVN